jgi:crotonobetainyl-CoA:carnitine CoA-transferase CaiB-like acyl-CoA transferase
MFDTADDPVVVAVGNDAQWRAALRAIGRLDDLASDNTLASNAGRVRARERVLLRMTQRLREAGSRHWLEVLSGAGVPCGRVRGVLESLREIGASELTGVPPSVPGSVRLPAPQLDQNGAEIRANGWGCF